MMRAVDTVRNKPTRLLLDRGFTLVELLIIVAILTIIATIAVAIYTRALENSRVTRAIGDIRTMGGDITLFYTNNRRYPDSLAEVGHGDRIDPWGHPYYYLNIETNEAKGKMRKDRFLVPLNSDYDLYSAGPDGQSVSALTARASRDDIIRANDGGYVGPVSDY
jgi:general secretion pathway protein G